MDTIQAIMIIEGDERTEYPDEVLELWQHLVDTGMVWRLHGSFGRTAMSLIENGLITCDQEIQE